MKSISLSYSFFLLKKVFMTKTTKGIIYLIFSAFCFSLMAVFVHFAGSINFMQKAFFRNTSALIIALSLLLKDICKSGTKSIIVPKESIKYLLLRSIAGSIGVFGNFYAIDHLILSDASILNKMSPFFAVIFSAILLKEKIKPIPLLAIIVAFCGSMLIIKPSFNFSQSLPSICGFLGGVGAGFAYTCVRKLSTQNCNGKVIVLIFSLFSSVLSLPFLIFFFEPMTFNQTMFLILSGVAAASGQFGITLAYYNAPAKEISIYDYSTIIFSSIFGFVFFNQMADLYSFLGYLIIISMAILNFIYNARRHNSER